MKAIAEDLELLSGFPPFAFNVYVMRQSSGEAILILAPG
jgi:hypothetical protein